jgi:nucleotide-binding universal stress UspA family protein
MDARRADFLWRKLTRRKVNYMSEATNTLQRLPELAGQTYNEKPFKLDRILVATDFSPNSLRAVRYSVQLAKRLGARLTILHVVPEPSALSYPMEGIPPEEVAAWQREAAKRLDQQVVEAKREYAKVDCLQRTAFSPRDEIVKVATELPADFLVLSTHGLTGWKHFLLGSYAEKILEHAPCPTAVVK